MSRVLQQTEKDGKCFPAWPFQSIREVDDIILPLLNEADMDGFLKITVDKTEKLLAFNTDGLTSLKELAPRSLGGDAFIAVLQNLYDLLDYLEESFIGLEYVAFDSADVYLDPESLKLHLAVLPLQSPEHADPSLGDLVSALIEKFRPDTEDAFYRAADEKTGAEMDQIADLENLIRFLKEEADKPSPAAAPEKEEEVPAKEEEVFWHPLFATETEAESKTDAGNGPEAEDPIPDPAQEVKAEEAAPEPAQEVKDKEAVSEPAQEVKDKEAVPEPAQEVKTEETAPAALQEVKDKEPAPEAVQEVNDKEPVPAEDELEPVKAKEPEPVKAEEEKPSAYLFRRRTSELITISSDPYIIGKIPAACDYTITDNPALSRIHAIIRYLEEEGAYFIIDCNSTNHIFLNGKKILGEQVSRLHDKDRIHLATEEFVFNLQI